MRWRGLTMYLPLTQMDSGPLFSTTLLTVTMLDLRSAAVDLCYGGIVAGPVATYRRSSAGMGSLRRT